MTDTDDDPRIKSLAAEPPTTLRVRWKDGGSDTVDLTGWIADNRDVLAGLRDTVVFSAPRMIAFDSAVEWGDAGGNLAIDAYHLKLLAAEQKPFGPADLVEWQSQVGMSNHEAAAFLDVALSTYGRWKAGEGEIPTMVRMVCRASLRDRLMISAYLRPRKAAGRPRKRAAA